MPIDGSYGRIKAHNERINELRRKKLKRREDKLHRNRNKKSHFQDEKVKPETIDPEKLRLIKEGIRRKGRANQKKEILLIIIALIIAVGMAFFIYLNIT